MTEIDVLCCGLLAADLCFTVSDLPRQDEKIFAQSFKVRSGGPATNAALTVKLLGGKSQLIAQTDASPIGNILIEQIIKDGFNTNLIIQNNNALTTAAVITEASGSRQVISCKATEQPQTLPTVIDHFSPAVILIDGHLPNLSLKLIKRFPDAQTVLDAGSVHEGTEVLADKVDWLITSAKYARQKSGQNDLQTAIDTLTAINSQVIITDGANGSIWSVNGQNGHTPAKVVDAIDSNGAGDVFHGAFAYGLSRKISFEECIKLASETAAESCTKPGVRFKKYKGIG